MAVTQKTMQPKVFNPKITKGSWEFKDNNDGDYTLFADDEALLWPYEGEASVVSGKEEDEKAINAVPQLLDILKSARKYIDKIEKTTFDFEVQDTDYLNLKNKIFKLDENHNK